MTFGIWNGVDGGYLTPEGTWTEDMGAITFFDGHDAKEKAEAKCAELMADPLVECKPVALEECVKCGNWGDEDEGYWKHTPATWDSPPDDEFICKTCGDKIAAAEAAYWDHKIAVAKGQ